MKDTRWGIALSLAIVAGLTLTGCGAGAPPADDTPDSATTAPSTDATDAPDAEKPVGDAEPSGDVAAPGSTIQAGQWASYDYVGVDDVKAVIAARLVGVDPATQAQADFLVEKIPQLKGYNIWMVKVEQKKVSGDPVAFNSDYTSFRAVTATKVKSQGVTMIGWDECKTQSFTKEFDNDGAVITQCIIAASVSGGDDVAGVEYAKYDSPYSPSDGKPLAFLK